MRLKGTESLHEIFYLNWSFSLHQTQLNLNICIQVYLVWIQYLVSVDISNQSKQKRQCSLIRINDRQRGIHTNGILFPPSKTINSNHESINH